MQEEHMEGALLKLREAGKKSKSKSSSWAGKGRSAAQVHTGDPSLTLQ